MNASTQPRCYWHGTSDCDHLGSASKPTPSYVPLSIAQELCSAIALTLACVGHDLSCPAYAGTWSMRPPMPRECSCFRSSLTKACAAAQKWGCK